MAESAAAKVRDFRLAGHGINGEKTDMGRIDQVVEKDTTEIWQVRNSDRRPHSFHVHDVQFQVLGSTGPAGAPPPQRLGPTL